MPPHTLNFLHLPTVNHRGDIIFAATVFNSGPSIRSNNTLLLNQDAVLSVALQGGITAPGTGLTFGDFSDPPVMNESGGIVVR